MRVIANILLSGFLDKYPKLKIVSVESGASWLPYLVEAMDWRRTIAPEAPRIPVQM